MQISKQLRILDFDMECRPLSWYGGDFVTKEPTAFAAAYVDEPSRLYRWTLRHSRTDDGFDEQHAELAELFRRLSEGALVTGHYIIGFDLPLMNNAAIRGKVPLMGDTLVSDTKQHLLKFSAMSKSQENLGALLDLEAKKRAMTTGSWESANRLTDDGIAEAQLRVISDVQMHIQMRQRMLERGMLGPTTIWKSRSATSGKYTP